MDNVIVLIFSLVMILAGVVLFLMAIRLQKRKKLATDPIELSKLKQRINRGLLAGVFICLMGIFLLLVALFYLTP